MSRTSHIDRKIKKKRIGLTFIILFLTITTLTLLFTMTTIFDIKEIEVLGTNVLEKEEMILVSGVKYGENIFKVNTNVMSKNVLSHPYVKQVSISRKLPNKLILKIKERTTIGAIEYIGSYVYIDDEGIVLNVLSVENSIKVPVISGINIDKINIGQILEIEKDKNINIIVSFLNDIKNSSLLENIRTVIINEDLTVQFEMKTGNTVAFGSLNNVKYKLSSLYSVIKDLESKNMYNKIIYLNKGNNPIVDSIR